MAQSKDDQPGFTDPEYLRHITAVEAAGGETPAAGGASGGAVSPTFVLVTPVEHEPLERFTRTFRSVTAQTRSRWTWLLATGPGTPADVVRFIEHQADHDARIRPLRRSEGFERRLPGEPGRWAVLLSPDTMLAPDALDVFARAAHLSPSPDVLYVDMDHIDEHGRRSAPLFKPGWSPETFLSVDLLQGAAAIRESLLADVLKRTAIGIGSEALAELRLLVAEAAAHIHHIPRVLAHRQSTPPPYARGLRDAGALRSHLRRRGLEHVSIEERDETWSNRSLRITWPPREARRVSIIVPSRDNAAVVRFCLTTLFARTQFPDFELIVVDTASQEPETFALYEQLAGRYPVRVVHNPAPFNFSQACNLGAEAASGELLLFLNNDTVVLHGDWLQRLAQWFDLPGIGVVGAKLLRGDGRIQHAGVTVGMSGIAGHLFEDLPEGSGTLFGSDTWYRNLLAVTAACLMIRRDAFDAVGGFDEEYRLLYGDTALCVAAHNAGYRVVYTPDARLIHYEWGTHGGLAPRADFVRAADQFSPWLEQGDPYFNPNLSYRGPRLEFSHTWPNHPLPHTARLLARLPDRDWFNMPDDIREE